MPEKPHECDDVCTPEFFADMPGHLLRRCHQIAVAIFLGECSDFDLTPLQFAILSALAREGPLDQITLGGITALDRTTVTVVVTKLEERALVTRKKLANDRRYKIVQITDAGKEIVAAVLPSVIEAQNRIFAPLEEHEIPQLRSLLKKLADANNSFSRAPLHPKITEQKT